MWKKMLSLLSFLLFTFLIHYTCAQSLSEGEKNEITKLAKIKIEDFETLLQIISDNTNNRGNIDDFIKSSYSREVKKIDQIFINEEATIENDLRPIDLTWENIEVSYQYVPDYLNDFHLHYQKSDTTTVIFNDIHVSNNIRGDTIVAYYKSEFKGKHKNHEEYQYKPIPREANLIAKYNDDKDEWEVLIASINYDRRPQGIELVDPIEKKKITEFPSTVSREVRETMQPKVGFSPLSFTSYLPETIKKGKTISLQWNQPVSNADLTLYREENEFKNIQQHLSGQQWNWKVQQKPSKNYYVQLDAGNERVMSGPIRIKPRFPLVLKVGIPVAMAGYLIYANSEKLWPFDEDGPLSPETNEIKIVPSVPNN